MWPIFSQLSYLRISGIITGILDILYGLLALLYSIYSLILYAGLHDPERHEKGASNLASKILFTASAYFFVKCLFSIALGWVLLRGILKNSNILIGIWIAVKVIFLEYQGGVLILKYVFSTSGTDLMEEIYEITQKLCWIFTVHCLRKEISV